MMKIPEFYLQVIRKSLEVATDTATMGESAKETLIWLEANVEAKND
jgi:hypothetical protein